MSYPGKIPSSIRNSFEDAYTGPRNTENLEQENLFEESIRQAGDLIMAYLNASDRSSLDIACNLTTPEMHIAAMRITGATASTFKSYQDCVYYTQSNPTRRLQKITDLDLSDQPKISTANFINMIRLMPDVEHLNLEGCERLRPRAFAAIANLSKLRSLKLAGCSELRDGELSLILERCSRLRELDVFDCNRLRGRAFARMDRHEELRSLTGNFYEAELQAIGQNCPNLEWLNHYCGENEETLAYLNNCHHLTQLFLSGNESVTAQGIDTLTLHHPNLLNLDLTECSSIEPQGFNYLQRLTQLDSLDLSGTQITDEVLISIVHHCPYLQTLRLIDCDISDRALDEIYALDRNIVVILAPD